MSEKFERCSGILLHITSLPGRYGIGGLGKEAYDFIDFLVKSGQKVWQICPIGPTGYADSPYAMYSSFAGNSLFIDLELFVKSRLLKKSDIEDVPLFIEEFVDFPAVHAYKEKIFRIAYGNFCKKIPQSFHKFENQEEKWLEDYALFMAIKNANGGSSWQDWEPGLREREAESLAKAKKELSEEILYHKFLQYTFFSQWQKLKQYANENGIMIIGDIPIYPSLDSADVWSKPAYYELDAQLVPIHVAGCPPDDFSETGQLWGNPLYNWLEHENENFEWWLERFHNLLKFVDIIRIDHFLGFEHYWSVPYGAKTAQYGEWQPGPSHKLFHALEQKLGKLPIIAEDLGVVTPAVEKLRDDFNFPGMKILQFAFGEGEDNPYLPHNYEENCVVYTGTHDNETTVGWYQNLPEHVKNHVRSYLSYLNFTDWEVGWKLIEAALDSKAVLAVAPLQDYLGLDNRARFNSPGTIDHNWRWRFTADKLGDGMAAAIKMMVKKANR
jgi:4-alpha-glucanotransferase